MHVLQIMDQEMFGGYESARISENTHRVSFAGQGHTNWSVKAYAIKRRGFS